MLMDCGWGLQPPPTLVVSKPLMWETASCKGQHHRDGRVVPSSSRTCEGGQVYSGDTGPSGAGSHQKGSSSLRGA